MERGKKGERRDQKQKRVLRDKANKTNWIQYIVSRKTEKHEKRGLLTSNSNSSTASTSLRTSATQRQEKAQPAQRQLLTAAVKVWHQAVGSLELPQLADVRRVADGEDGLEPARSASDGTTMHPDVEARATAVGAVATLTDTAEGQGRDVQGGVITRDTTGPGGGNN